MSQFSSQLSSQFSGRAWVFGDDINTDLLAPGAYMKFGIDEIARHCMESVDPAFAATVKPGDIVFGGRNFGAGSSRERGFNDDLAERAGSAGHRNGFFVQHEISGQSVSGAHTMVGET